MCIRIQQDQRICGTNNLKFVTSAKTYNKSVCINLIILILIIKRRNFCKMAFSLLVKENI